MSRINRGSEVYRRRIERALARGLSRSAARGHAKFGEDPASKAPRKPDLRIKDGVALIAAGQTLSGVARELGISRERLRTAVAEQGSYKRRGRRHVFVPHRPNDLPLYSQGASIRVRVDEENAARLGSYMAAVRRFLRTNQADHLRLFVGQGVTDLKGKVHVFETDPEALYQLAARGRPEFLKNYQQPTGAI